MGLGASQFGVTLVTLPGATALGSIGAIGSCARGPGPTWNRETVDLLEFYD